MVVIFILQAIPSLDHEGVHIKISKYVNWNRLWPHSTPYPASSFRPLDTAAIDMTVSTGQPVVTSEVPTQVMTNPSINATNPFVKTMNTSTNQGASGCPTCHGWVWFWLEGQSGGSLGPAQTECQSIALVMHQELEVMPLRIQQLSYHDVLIEFDSEVDVEWVAQKQYSGWNGGWGPMPPRMCPLQQWRRASTVQGRGMGGPQGWIWSG